MHWKPVYQPEQPEKKDYIKILKSFFMVTISILIGWLCFATSFFSFLF